MPRLEFPQEGGETMWARREKHFFMAGAILSAALMVAALALVGDAFRRRIQCTRQDEFCDILEAIDGREQNARELYARLWHLPREESLREKYNGTVAELRALYGRARSLTADNPELADEIMRLGLLHEDMRSIEAKALVSTGDALEPILSDDYQQSAHRFRSSMRSMLTHEKARQRDAFSRTHWATVLGATGAAVGGGLILLTMLSGAHVRRRSIQNPLLQVLDALEQAASGRPAQANQLAAVAERPDLVGDVARAAKALLMVCEDARAQAIEALALCHSVLDTLPEIVCVLNADGSLRYANSSLTMRTGWSQEEIHERLVVEHSWFHPEDELRMRERLCEVFAGHTVPQAEYRARRRDGHYIRLRENLVPVRGSNGKVIAAVVVATDVTEQERARGDLERSARLTELGLLTRSVLAEFNNLMASIHAQVEAALRTGGGRIKSEPEEVTSLYHESLRSIWRTVSRAVVLSRNLQSSFGEHVCERKPCSMSEQVQTAISFLLNELRGHGMGCREEHQEAPAVMGDTAQLRQAFTNLLEALLSSSIHGTADTIEVRTRPTDSVVEAVLRSTVGPGIPEEELRLAVLPDPFAKEVPEETAARVFGLSVAQRIIAAHGGALEFAHGVGQPWHVRVRLPAISEKAPDSLQRQDELSRLAPMRILVVDEAPIQNAMKVFLEDQGHAVVPCVDLYAACRALETARYDVVFCEITTSRFGGPKALRELLLRHPTIPVVVLTSDPTPETAEEAMRDGAFEWLQKPFGMEDVRQTLERIQRQPLGSDDGDTVDG